MVSENCPACSQNLHIFIETVVDPVFIYKLEIGGLSNLLNGFSSQTFKKWS